MGTTFTIAHDILTALVHAIDIEQDPDIAIFSPPRAYGRSDERSPTLASFFKDHLNSVFTLNKDPLKIEQLIRDMKEDFGARSGSQLQPNRLIFFQGGSKFYKELFTGEAAYWLTGYKMGSLPDMLQMSVNGLNYCESFAVKQ